MPNTAESATPRFPIVPYMLLAAAVLIVINTFSVLSSIILSFLLTVLISLAVNPVILKLRALTGGRKLATGLIFLLFVVSMALLGWLFYLPIRNSLDNLAEALPTYWERLQKPLILLEKKAASTEQRMQEEVKRETEAQSGDSQPAEPQSDETPQPNTPQNNTTNPQKAKQTEETGTAQAEAPEPAGGEADPNAPTAKRGSIRSQLGEMVFAAVGNVTVAAFNGAQIFVVLVTVFFGVIFMLLDPRPIISGMFLVVPEQYHDRMLTIMKRISEFAPSWAGSTLAGMVTIGMLVFLLMWPILGLMDAVVLGLIACLFECIPFLGPTLSTIPALLLSMGKGGLTPLWVVLAYITVQALENNVILPMIMSHGMKVHAVAVIFSMLLCVSAFGVLGVIVAAPLVAVLTIVHDELFRKKYLPNTTDEDLNQLARKSLHEKPRDSD